jgi:hypothetical protein
MRPFKTKFIVQTIAAFAALYAVDQGWRGYQAAQVEQVVNGLLNHHDYESAIQVLREANQKRFHPKLAERLAGLLTVSPRMSARDYSQAILLSNQVIQSSASHDLKMQAFDTLACARFANREEKAAIEIAEKNQLKERSEQFAIGRPCQQRSIASEKN